MLLLAAVVAVAVVVAGTGLVSESWDSTVVAVVVGLAAATDLALGLRSRDFVVVGPDAVVVRNRGRTTSTPWPMVGSVEHCRTRWGRWRAELRVVGSSPVRLPSQAPVEELREWVRRGRPDGPGAAG